MSLADALVDGLDRVRLSCTGSSPARGGELLEIGLATIAKAPRDGEGQAIGVVLDNSIESVAVVLGAIVANVPLVSLPTPVRHPSKSTRSLESFVVRHDLMSVVVSDSLADRLRKDSAAVPVLRHSEFARFGHSENASRLRGSGEFQLVQYTSGSAGAPKGVVLSGSSLFANIEATLEILQPETNDHVCSWLPLSHDMGLVGMLLAPIVAAGPRWTGGVTVTLLEPSTYLRSPGRWLRAVAEQKATVTASPDFGLRYATRHGSTTHGNLSSIRACMVGAEVVRPSTLRACERTLLLHPKAVCPAYGMAEAGLAVSFSPPGRKWRSVVVGAPTVEHDGDPGVDGQPLEAVLCGPPLPGYQLGSAANEGGSELLVRGPSLERHYADGTALLDADGWFHTADLGTVVDGEVVVFGRLDDVVVAAGRQFLAGDLERELDDSRIRPGRVLAVQAPGGRWAVVAEVRKGRRQQAAALAADLRRACAHACGATPDGVVVVEAGEVPITTSGKPRRQATAHALAAGRLKIVAALGSIDEESSLMALHSLDEVVKP